MSNNQMEYKVRQLVNFIHLLISIAHCLLPIAFCFFALKETTGWPNRDLLYISANDSINDMRTVEDILGNKPRPFNFIEPDALVFDALQLMNSVNLSYLIVMNGNTFHGIFSERDYSRNVILKGLHSNSTAVKDVMSVALPMVDLHESVDRCMELINTHKTRYLLVFEQGTFVGVVTINDLLREVMANRDLYYNSEDVAGVTEIDDKIY